MKKLSVAALFLIASLLSGCAVRDENSSPTPETQKNESAQFSSTEISEYSSDNPTDEESSSEEYNHEDREKYSILGATVNFEYENFLEYNGEPINFQAVVSNTNGNTTDLELGISITINGFRQTFSVDGGKPTEMYIKTYAPGSGDLLNITLDPQILEKDKDAELLAINYVVFWFPTAVDKQNPITLDDARHVSFDGSAIMEINSPITNFIDEKQEENVEVTKKTLKNERELVGENYSPYSSGEGNFILGIEPANISEENDNFLINDDGSGDFTVYGDVEDNRKYRVTIFDQNGMRTFNDGKTYLEMEMKEGDLCFKKVNIPNLKPGDYIYALFTPFDMEVGYDDKYGKYFTNLITRANNGMASDIRFADKDQ